MARTYIEGDEARIERTDFCKVTLTYYDGRRIENLEPRRLFPLSGLHKYITLLDGDGREAAIIRSLDTLIPESRRAVEECLEEFYLIPRITGIYDITDKKGSLSWHVQTDRGERRFSIRNRHSDIKVLYDGACSSATRTTTATKSRRCTSWTKKPRQAEKRNLTTVKGRTDMTKLVLAIINNDDSAIAASALNAEGFFVTKLSTTAAS